MNKLLKKLEGFNPYKDISECDVKQAFAMGVVQQLSIQGFMWMVACFVIGLTGHKLKIVKRKKD